MKSARINQCDFSGTKLIEPAIVRFHPIPSF
jgi:hypothetical protein